MFCLARFSANLDQYINKNMEMINESNWSAAFREFEREQAALKISAALSFAELTRSLVALYNMCVPYTLYIIYTVLIGVLYIRESIFKQSCVILCLFHRVRNPKRTSASSSMGKSAGKAN
jgi:hypothetical protein